VGGRVSGSLYPSVPLSFEAPGVVSDAVQRLRSAVKRTGWHTPFRESLVGRVSASRVVLRRYRPWMNNGFAPTFVGGFVQRGDRVLLQGALTLHPLIRMFMTLALSCLAVLLAIGLGRLFVRPMMGDELLFLVLVLGAALCTVALMRVSHWFGRQDVSYIEDRIASALGASVVRDDRLRGAESGGVRIVDA
jgi:hypothetical protein